MAGAVGRGCLTCRCRQTGASLRLLNGNSVIGKTVKDQKSMKATENIFEKPELSFVLSRVGYGAIALATLIIYRREDGASDLFLFWCFLYLAIESPKLSGKGAIEEWSMSEKVTTSVIGLCCVGLAWLSVLS